MIPESVLITGGRGFVGRALVNSLQSAGCAVFHIGRLDAESVWARAQGRCDAIVHLANIAHRKSDWRELQRTNVDETRRLAERAIATGLKHFVYISSIKVHGEQSLPGGFTEATPVNPVDAYGESKVRAEQALGTLSSQLRICVLRPPLVYGPYVKANFLALVGAIAHGWPLPLSSVRNRRSLIYVGNLVDAIIRCLDVEGTFLVSDGDAVSTPQLCREIGEALGRPARLFPFPPIFLPDKLASSLEVDDSLIRRTLGWRPPYTRQEGLKATAEWYLAR